MTKGCATTVLRSLALLGFRERDYRIDALSVKSFSKQGHEKVNEKALLACLHFLFSQIEASDFTGRCQDCFPYQNAQQRIKFRRILQESLTKYAEAGTLPPAAARSSWLMAATGPGVWDILWRLSDIALDSVSLPPSINDESASLLRQIEETCRDIHSAQGDRAQYSRELDGRLHQAVRIIESAKAKLKVSVKHDSCGAASTKGKLARTEMLGRIKGSILLLRDQAATLQPLLERYSTQSPPRTANRSVRLSQQKTVAPLEEIISALTARLRKLDPQAVVADTGAVIARVNAVAQEADEVRIDAEPLSVQMQERRATLSQSQHAASK